MERKKQVPPPNDLQFFDPEVDKVPAANEEEADARLEYLGLLTLFSSGRDKWLEACDANGMTDLAQRARVAWSKSQKKLYFKPAPMTDEKALTVSWQRGQSNAKMRLRSVFIRYGIEMLEDSVWHVTGQVEDVPGFGVCLTLDLDEVLRGVDRDEPSEAAASEQASDSATD